MTNERKRWASGPILALIIVVVLVNAGFAFAAIQSLLRSASWLSHTWQAIGQTESIMSSVRDGEAGVRGYIITGNTQYLKGYLTARGTIQSQVEAFARLTADNIKQKANVDNLRLHIGRRMEQLQTAVEIRRDQGFEAARDRALAGNGLAETDNLRVIAADIESEELRLLSLRQTAQQRSAVLAEVATGVAAGLDLLFIVLIFRYLARERVLRYASEDTARQLSTANEEIARTSSELQLLNAELEDRVRQRTADLESTNRELEAFSYSVSHDLRAPLRTIDGFSLALQEDYTDAVDSTGRDYIARVRAGVQRMGGLIDALLQLSRITRAEINRTTVDVTALVQSVGQNLRDENPDQILHFDIESGMYADADPGLLRVAFENLMGNAVKFSSRKPESHIVVAFDKEKQAFRVQDDGAGFDMHYSEKLFNAFNRLHGDKDFKGSGIGLATVARVVRRHRGTIWADSQVGHGATFWFTLG